MEKWPYGSPFFCLWAGLVGSPSSSVQVGLDRSPYLLVRLWMTLAAAAVVVVMVVTAAQLIRTYAEMRNNIQNLSEHPRCLWWVLLLSRWEQERHCILFQWA